MSSYKVNFDVTGIGAVNKAMSNINKKATATTKQVQRTNHAFHAQRDIVNQLSGGINVLGFGFNTLLKTATAFDGNMKGIGLAINDFQKAFNKASNSGKSFFQSGIEGFKGLGKSAVTFRGILFSSVAPLLAIGAAVFTLKKIWDNNIGGIQTHFQQLVGQFKQLWAEFEVTFIQGLRKMEPVFSAVFGAIMKTVQVTMKILGGLFKGLMHAVQPIIDIFKEMGSIMSEAFGDSSEEGQGFMKVASALGKTLEFVGKIMGALLKVALTPMRLAITGIMKGGIALRDTWEKFKSSFKETAIFKSLMKIFEQLKDAFFSIIDLINKIPGINIPTEVEDNVRGQGGKGEQPQNVRNDNRQINVNTSREISRDGAKGFEEMLAMSLDN